MAYLYLFGPVSSRRFGLSLGVDLVPYKTCSMDCVYCECGRTTNLTTDYGDYTPADDVISELRDYLGAGPPLDAVTFSGSGEPTLHTRFGDVCDLLREEFPHYRRVLLTNSVTMTDPAKRREMTGLDIVVPSLDAVTQVVFDRINRPAAAVSAEAVVNGLAAFRGEFTGEMWLEIFIVPGLNDDDAELRRLREAAAAIRPDKVQINTLDRPGTEKWVKGMTTERLREISDLFQADIITAAAPRCTHREDGEADGAVLATIRRRPSTVGDLAQSLGLEQTAVEQSIARLRRRFPVRSFPGERGNFYECRDQDKGSGV